MGAFFILLWLFFSSSTQALLQMRPSLLQTDPWGFHIPCTIFQAPPHPIISCELIFPTPCKARNSKILPEFKTQKATAPSRILPQRMQHTFLTISQLAHIPTGNTSQLSQRRGTQLTHMQPACSVWEYLSFKQVRQCLCLLKHSCFVLLTYVWGLDAKHLFLFPPQENFGDSRKHPESRPNSQEHSLHSYSLNIAPNATAPVTKNYRNPGTEPCRHV